MLAWSLYDLGEIDVAEGGLQIARERLAEALRIFVDAGDVSGYTLVLDAFAALCMAMGDLERAARISGAVDNLERLTGAGLNPLNRTIIGYDPSALRDRPELRAAWDEGARMEIQDVIAYALETEVPEGVAPQTGVGSAPAS